MITALVHYKIWNDGGHPMLEGYYVDRTELVEVGNLMDLKKSFVNITKVDILAYDGKPQCSNCGKEWSK